MNTHDTDTGQEYGALDGASNERATEHAHDTITQRKGHKPSLSIRLEQSHLEGLKALVAAKQQQWQELGVFATVTTTAVIAELIDREIKQTLCGGLPAPKAPRPRAKRQAGNDDSVVDLHALHVRLESALASGKKQAEIADAAGVDRGAISAFKTKTKLWPAAAAKLDAALTEMGA